MGKRITSPFTAPQKDLPINNNNYYYYYYFYYYYYHHYYYYYDNNNNDDDKRLFFVRILSTAISDFLCLSS